MTDNGEESAAKVRAHDSAASEGGEPRLGTQASRWGSIVSRGGGLVDRLTGSVKEGVKEAGRGLLFKQALAARERGNLAAAFYLLEEDYRERPEDVDLANIFWDVAVEYQRAADAVPAVSWLIRRYASKDAAELASQYWDELCSCVPDALVEPAALVRIVPILREQVEAEKSPAAKARREEILLRSLRGIVDERNHEGLSTGIAMHTAELARDIDPQTALRAARFALESDALHEAKRSRLQQLISELMSDEDPRMEAAATDAEAEPNAEAEPDGEAEPDLEAGADAMAEPDTEAVPDAVAESNAESELDAEAERPAEAPEPESSPGARAAPSLHPARNHPLHVPDSPAEPELTDEQVAALQTKLALVASRSGGTTPASGGGEEGSGASDDLGRILNETTGPLNEPALVSDSADDVEFVPTPTQTEAAAEDPLATNVEIPRFADVQAIPAEPMAFDETGIHIRVAGGRRRRIAYAKIQALAVGQVSGLAEEPVTLIDLLLNWHAVEGGPLRLVRVRADEFDPLDLARDERDEALALGAFLGETLERSHAVPLPDPDAALGLAIPEYDSLASYERAVLQVSR